MKKFLILWAALIGCGILCGSPYGKALQKARQVRGDAEKRTAEALAGMDHGVSPAEINRQKALSKPLAKPAAGGDEFKQLWLQAGKAAHANKGVLPGPAGIEGLKKMCGPGGVAPEVLKIKDFGRMTEKNCPWAYVGGELGRLKALPKGVRFPVLFSKPAPGAKVIVVLFSDGSVSKYDARNLRSCAAVVKFLRNSSGRAKHPAWNKLNFAAGQIDRAQR